MKNLPRLTILFALTLLGAAFAMPQDAIEDPERLAKLLARALHAEGDADAKVSKLEAESARIAAALRESRTERDRVVRIRKDLQRRYEEALKPPPPPVEPDPPSDELEAYLASMPFADKIPALPEYRIPTEADCHWVIEAGVARSTKGLPNIPATEAGDVAGTAYRASMAAGHELPIVFGVVDDGGRMFGGGLWYHSNEFSLTHEIGGQWQAIEFEVVGLTDTAEVRLGWGARWGMVEHVGAFNIGLRGASDSFVIRANDPVGTVILDGCWFLPGIREDGSAQNHASGLHMDQWGTAILRRTKWRGKQPGTPGINLREHVFYLKSSRGQTWIVENDLKGGNRTGFQIRPEPANQAEPIGPVVIALNHSDGYGWNHGMSGGSFDGGSAITVWTNPRSDTFVLGNRITDAKYGCLVLAGQDPARNWLNENGFPIHEVWVWDNVFENSQQGRPATLPKRGAASVTAVERLHWGPNDLQLGARLTLNSRWGMERHGIANGEVLLYDRGILADDVRTWDASIEDVRPMTVEEREALLVE